MIWKARQQEVSDKMSIFSREKFKNDKLNTTIAILEK